MNADQPLSQTDASDDLSAWSGAIYIGLAERKNEATSTEILRLAKTLRRLEPSAYAALIHTHASAHATNQDFPAVLKELSHG